MTDFTVTTDELDGIFITGGKDKQDSIYSNKTYLIKKTESEKLSIQAYPRMNFARCGHIAVYNDFKLFVFGGENDNNTLTTVEFYDIISGHWLQIKAIPGAYIKDNARCIIYQNKVFYLSGLKHFHCIEIVSNENNMKEVKENQVKVYYDDSYNLSLRNFVLIGNFAKRSTDSASTTQTYKFFILGGENEIGPNYTIFSLEFQDKVMLKKETVLDGFQFKFSNQSANSFSEENDFIFLLGEDKENKVSVFKVYDTLDIEEVFLFK